MKRVPYEREVRMAELVASQNNLPLERLRLGAPPSIDSCQHISYLLLKNCSYKARSNSDDTSKIRAYIFSAVDSINPTSRFRRANSGRAKRSFHDLPLLGSRNQSSEFISLVDRSLDQQVG